MELEEVVVVLEVAVGVGVVRRSVLDAIIMLGFELQPEIKTKRTA